MIGKPRNDQCGAQVNTAAIRAACDDLDWLASLDSE